MILSHSQNMFDKHFYHKMKEMCTSNWVLSYKSVIYTPPRIPSQSVQTLHKNCTQQRLNQAFNSGTNNHGQMHTLPLCHCSLLYIANLCYICNLWLNWETYLLLFNMGHMIYVLDQFFSVNSMGVSILRSD